MEENRLAIEDGKNEIIGILNKRGSTKGKIQRYDTMLEQIGIRKSELNQKLLHLKSDEAQQVQILEKLQKSYEAINENVRKMKQSYEEVDAQIAGLQNEISNRTGSWRLDRALTTGNLPGWNLLKNITERYDGYGNSIRKVMEQKERNPGIHGVVADLFKTQKSMKLLLRLLLAGAFRILLPIMKVLQSI